MSADGDRTEALCEAVARAARAGRGLRIIGSGSKAFLTGGQDPDAHAGGERLLSVAEHRGIVEYRPEALVVTVRAGTPLRELERALGEANQYLPFEPPMLRGGGTVGGAVASGLAGPGRPWRGGVRDALLGVELINGLAERLCFGGQVMKNVAGYDVSRLQAGAFGTLGVLLGVSLKVLPKPAAEASRVFELDAEDAVARCREWARRAWPITGACHVGGLLRVRLSGAAAAVAEAGRTLGGEADRDTGFWSALRDLRLPFFTGGGLWRCVVPPAAGAPLGDCLIDWAGGLRWWRPGPDDQPVETLRGQSGHGRPFGTSFGIRSGAHVPEPENRYALRLKHAFDPNGVLNPALTPGMEKDLAH
jgi:glycolate oxidase FAD binding subunit